MSAHTTIKRGVRPMSPAALAAIIPGVHVGQPQTLSGPLAVYHEGATNHCPGCHRVHWHIGRSTAECAFCHTALPLAATLQNQDAGLERPRLIRARAEARHTSVRLDATSNRRRAA